MAQKGLDPVHCNPNSFEKIKNKAKVLNYHVKSLWPLADPSESPCSATSSPTTGSLNPAALAQPTNLTLPTITLPSGPITLAKQSSFRSRGCRGKNGRDDSEGRRSSIRGSVTRKSGREPRPSQFVVGGARDGDDKKTRRRQQQHCSSAHSRKVLKNHI